MFRHNTVSAQPLLPLDLTLLFYNMNLCVCVSGGGLLEPTPFPFQQRNYTKLRL
jgi:hypothetical protein